MRKVIIIIILAILIIGLGIGVYFGWQKYKYKLFGPKGMADIIGESTTKGVMPAIESTANPLEKMPAINPAGAANPFKNVKTNPFE